MKYITVHPGARDYYLLSAGLHRLNSLEKLYTDIYMKQDSYSFLKKRLRIRHSNLLPDNLVQSYNNQFLIYNIYNKVFKAESYYEEWIKTGRRLSLNVVDELKKDERSEFNIWGFTCANLELIEYAKRNNISTTLTQVDGGIGYYTRALQIWEKYPYAEKKPVFPPNAFLDRIEAEMRLTDNIVVNSLYIREFLIKNYPFLSNKKVQILPLAFEKPNVIIDISTIHEKYKQPDWTIIWVGNINLMKGFLTFYEVAKQLANKGFKFFAAGNSFLSESFYLNAQNFITFTGKLSKSALFSLYEKSHAFLFPTLCDSFGMVQLEAMTFGLPVLSTDNCADIVVDSKNGFIIPEDSSDLIIEKLLLLKNEENLYASISINCLLTSERFSLDNYLLRLKNYLNDQ